MPIPKPNENETKEEFVSRCMGNETMREEYPDQEQRAAICYSQWRKKHGGEPPEDSIDLDKKESYGIKSLSPTEGEMWIYEAIGEGWFGGITASQFAKDLKSLGKIKNLTLRINSPGGDVFDGVAIYNLLKQSQSYVTIYIDGLAASIASVIAMAGDKVLMADNAMMMIHDAWGMGIGNARDFRELADRLEKVSGTIHLTYLKRTGLDAQTITDMMAEETWMTATEALEYGFVDNLTDELKLAAHYDLSKFKFKNLPRENQSAQECQSSKENQSSGAAIDESESETVDYKSEKQTQEPEYLPPHESRQWFAQKLEEKQK